MRMRGSRILVECLKKEKVEVIFHYTGGSIISIYDDLHRYGKGITCMQPRHEQAGTHAADAYARSTGKVGVVLVTSGPGATNTVTGIATAYKDSIPMVVLTGQVPTAKIGSNAFQEADVTGITLPLTKKNFQVKSVDQMAMILQKAFHTARSGKPGPVLVDIPSDMQTAETEFVYPEKPATEPAGPPCDRRQLAAAVRLINGSHRPLVLAGGGVIFSDSAHLLNRWLDRTNIPVVTTLMGHGICPENEDLFYGGIGMHGSLYGNFALQQADVIIALGARFSDRIVGDAATFAPNALIIQVDIDAPTIGKHIRVDVPVVADVKEVLQSLLQARVTCDTTEWVTLLSNCKKKNPLKFDRENGLKAQYVVETANRLFPHDTIVAADVGQNQMWVAQHFRFRNPRSLMSSSGLGTMGFGLPAALGAKIGNPHREVLMVSGDGGFQMNMQELATIKQYNLTIKMLILDNAYLGMVRQWQELFSQKHYKGTAMDDNPDFVKIARAFGIKAAKVTEASKVEQAIAKLVNSKESMLLHALVDREENVLPMVPAGKSLDQALVRI
ncbi:MAG: biosynthetic-type acetolactate synthase large subunit [bacterium]|nr:biosynthetic-type acetolactate synthase large subunit [bacterium]